VSTSTPYILWQRRSSKAWRPFSGDVCGWGVCAKNWQLPPSAPSGMAVGAHIPQAHPAPIRPIRMRTDMLRGVPLACSATCGGNPGGGAAGVVTGGACRTCSHAAHGGMWVRPAKGFAARERGGEMGVARMCPPVPHALGQTTGSMTQSHTRTTNAN
jgi:hypothetical protein